MPGFLLLIQLQKIREHPHRLALLPLFMDEPFMLAPADTAPGPAQAESTPGSERRESQFKGPSLLHITLKVELQNDS